MAMLRKMLSFIPCVALTALGLFFLSPIIYRPHPFEGNVVGPSISIILGSSLLLIGASSLLRSWKSCKSIDAKSANPYCIQDNSSHSHQTHTEQQLDEESTKSIPTKRTDPLSSLGRGFMWLGNSAIGLSVMGALLVLLPGAAGSVSGVPLGIGIVIAVIFYSLWILCTLLDKATS